MQRLSVFLAFMLAAAVVRGAEPPSGNGSSTLVFRSADGKLNYKPYTDRGDVIPDFSRCGYGGGGVELPTVPVKVTVPSTEAGDDTKRIQAAIDQVAKLSPDKNGFRGAVLLQRGRYRIEDALRISVSGIVLRGEGQGEDGTVLIGTGKSARYLINVGAKSGVSEMKGTRQRITTDYMPVGARRFEVKDGSKFKMGDTVLVARIGNATWVHELGMDRIAPRTNAPERTKQWEPFSLNFDRVITAVDGNHVTIDAPIVCAIETRWGGGDVRRYTDRRIEHVGVENLRGESEFDHSVKLKKNGEYFADEKHATGLVSFDNVKNAWARDLTAIYFYNGVSWIEGGAKWVTVQDCTCLDPVSELTGGRRYAFNINGQLCLIQRCTARNSRHAFVLGARVPGPNVFLDCRSEQDHATSEPHHRWSVGGLYDNVHAPMAIQDRQWLGSGHGWAGANYMVWNGEGTLVCQQPPTAQNFAIGFVGKPGEAAFERPNGWWESKGQHVEPRSLYLKQLEDRLKSK